MVDEDLKLLKQVRKDLINQIRPATATTILSKLSSSKRVAGLWEATPGLLAEWFPPFGADQEFDHSAADAALMTILARVTFCNEEAMRILFSMSKLYRSDKGRRSRYMDNIVSNAVWVAEL